MRVVYIVSLVAAGFGLLGCSSTSKNPPRGSSTSSPPASINNNQPFWAQPDKGKSPVLNQPLGSRADLGGDGMKLTSAEQPDVNGILAGKLIDVLGAPVLACVYPGPTSRQRRVLGRSKCPPTITAIF